MQKIKLRFVLAFILIQVVLNPILEIVHVKAEEPNSTKIRIIHASTDAPNVDIYFDKDPIVTELEYKSVTNYVPVLNESYKVKVYPQGSDPQKEKPIITKKIKTKQKQLHTLALTGEDDKFELLLIDDTNKSAKDDSSFRVVHLSPDTPIINVTSDNNVILEKLAYKKASDYVNVESGTVNIQFRLSDSMKVLYEIPNLELLTGNTYTVFALGLYQGEPTLEVIITKD